MNRNVGIQVVFDKDGNTETSFYERYIGGLVKFYNHRQE